MAICMQIVVVIIVIGLVVLNLLVPILQQVILLVAKLPARKHVSALQGGLMMPLSVMPVLQHLISVQHGMAVMKLTANLVKATANLALELMFKQSGPVMA